MNDILKITGIYEKGFGNIPKLVMQDRRLTRDAKCIYSYFCSFAGAGKTDSFPSVEKICFDLSFGDERTFRKHLKKLVEYGYITVSKTRTKSGIFCRNIYTINTTIKNHLSIPENLHSGHLSTPENFRGGKSPGIKQSISNTIKNTNTNRYHHQGENITKNDDDVLKILDDANKNIKEEAKAVKEPVKDVKKESITISKQDMEYLNTYRANFKALYKATLKETNVKELYIEKGKEAMEYYLENYKTFLESSTKGIKNIAGYFYSTVKNEYPIPSHREAKADKPIQSTNYEQRQYSDEYYNSLYDNVTFVKNDEDEENNT
jgi:hypothetical protein